jgi:hypothetical protein
MDHLLAPGRLPTCAADDSSGSDSDDTSPIFSSRREGPKSLAELLDAGRGVLLGQARRRLRARWPCLHAVLARMHRVFWGPALQASSASRPPRRAGRAACRRCTCVRTTARREWVQVGAGGSRAACGACPQGPWLSAVSLIAGGGPGQLLALDVVSDGDLDALLARLGDVLPSPAAAAAAAAAGSHVRCAPASPSGPMIRGPALLPPADPATPPGPTTSQQQPAADLQGDRCRPLPQQPRPPHQPRAVAHGAQPCTPGHARPTLAGGQPRQASAARVWLAACYPSLSCHITLSRRADWPRAASWCELLCHAVILLLPRPCCHPLPSPAACPAVPPLSRRSRCSWHPASCPPRHGAAHMWWT